MTKDHVDPDQMLVTPASAMERCSEVNVKGRTSEVTTCPRSRVHEAATWCAQRVAVGLDYFGGRRAGGGFSILTYHRVSEHTPGVESPTVNVTPKRLRAQLRGLLDRGFEAWPLKKAVEAHTQQQVIPENVFVVTFDDGYENNLHAALPVLQELQVPATIFIATGYLDSREPFPFENWSMAGSDRVPAASWRPLSTNQCHELLASGWIELGAHTHTHRVFTENATGFQRDLARSVEILEEHFGITEPTFSFPFGVATTEMIIAAEQSGVCCALSTRPQRITVDQSPFVWGRFNACDTDTAATLTAKLHGWYTPVADILRVVKRPVAAIAPQTTGELNTFRQPRFRQAEDRRAVEAN